MATRRTAGQSQSSSGSSSTSGSKRSGRASTARTAKDSSSTGSTGSTSSTGRRRAETSDASAAGATARARISAARKAAARAGTRPKTKSVDESIAGPTVTATDEVMAASNAQQALSPDMPRVAWLRNQLQNLEAERAERLKKVAQLTLIALIFMTFVLQNADPVNVTFLFFSLNIRLIWVIVGCGLLGGAAGYLIGRPEKSLRALLPEKDKPGRKASTRRAAGV